MANITLKLEVKDKHGNYLNNVEVTSNGVNYYTDDSGVVEFSVPRDEDCVVSFRKDGFKELTKTINKRDLVHTVEIQMEDYIATTVLVKIKDEIGNVPYCHFELNGDLYSTDNTGRLEITENIRVGEENLISVHENGYDVARVKFTPIAEKRNYVFVNLNIQQNSTAYLFNKVYDACNDNTPLANADVILFSNETSRIIARRRTNDMGEIDEVLEVYNKTTDLLI
jgi:hypothetical protein